MLFTNNFKLYLAIFCALFISSCSQIEKRGYSFELSGYEELHENIHNKEDVKKLMGYPTFTDYNENGNETWFYYSEEVKNLLFFRPKILSRQITSIKFGKNQIISQITNYDLEDEKELKFSQNLTPVKINEKRWWQKIFGNIGSVRAE